MFFLSYSNSFILAQTPAITVDEIGKIETEAVSLRNIWNEQAVRQSLELFVKASKQWESLGNLPNAARCLREAAKLEIMLSEEASSIETLQNSLRLEKKTKNSGGEAETFILLTVASFKTGKNEQSRIYHRQALSKAEKAAQPGVNAAVFFYSAAFYLNEQNFPEMKSQLERSLEIYQTLGNKQGQTEVLTELAYGYTLNNDRIRGRDCARRALEIAREINSLRGQTFALIALGDAFQRMGELENAIKAFNEADSLFPENLDINEKAILINRIGFYYLSFDDLVKAKQYFQDSLTLFNKLKLTDGSSMLLSILAQISVRQKNYEDAERYFEESRKVLIDSRDLFSLTTLESEIGDYFLELNRLDEARVHLESALDYSKKLGVSYKIAEAEAKLGTLFEKKGDFKNARAKFSGALELNQKILSKFAQGGNYYNLAKLDLAENQLESAFKNIAKSVELTESSQNETSNLLLKRTYFSNVFERYEFYIGLLMKMHARSPGDNYAVEALQAAEKSRARALLENLLLSQADFTKDADVETLRREKEIRARLNAKADQLVDLIGNKAEKSETDKIGLEINELESELEEIKVKLKEQSPVYSAIKNPAPFDVADFQQTVLDENSLLLEFSLGTNESYLWAVGKNEVTSYVLPPRAEIEPHVGTLRRLLNERRLKSGETIEDFQQRIAQTEAAYQAEAAALSRKLFGQIAAEITDKKLIIVPDGALHYFPVAALPLPGSATGDPILLTNETVYEPSAQTLAVLNKSRPVSVPAKNLLVFSDPIFTSDDERLSAGNKTKAAPETALETDRFRFAESLNNLPRLAASKDESEIIAETVGTANTENYSGFAATRENLLNLKTNEYKILHFATHGYANEERPELSGIVFSRFDEKGQELNEFFRIQDIYALNLNADLVVLSACETGVGKQFRGEGLMSLNNAFLQTGAKSVVASLWKVEDSATLELMKNFYGALANERLTPSQSLRRAQIKLRENPQYRSPFYWAAFTVQGDFRSVPNLSGGYGFWIYLLPILPLPLVGFYFYRRKRKRSELRLQP